MGNPKKDHNIIHTPNIQEVLNANKKGVNICKRKKKGKTNEKLK